MQSPAKVRFRCPCCDCLTLEAPEALALCPVCWWEDDGQDGDLGSTVADEVRSTVNGDLSLNQARQNYLEYGAAHSGFMRFVRQPTPEEQ